MGYVSIGLGGIPNNNYEMVQRRFYSSTKLSIQGNGDTWTVNGVWGEGVGVDAFSYSYSTNWCSFTL